MIKEIDITIPILELNNINYYKQEVSRVLNLDFTIINDIIVEKRSIDARKGNIVYRLKLLIYTDSSHYIDNKDVSEYKYVKDSPAVIIVGAGPAGLFAALHLLERGLKPVIIERGKNVHERKKDIAILSRQSIVNPDSNYCFGEGGAGTFSDGKLYTRSTKRGNVYDIFRVLVEHGADKDIMIDAHPHIGTDKLPLIMENIRHTIIDHGGEYYFNSRIVDFDIRGNEIKGVIDNHGTKYEGIAVILATGHSARNIYELMYDNKIDIVSKGFALGVRVEHPRELIDNIQYHGNRHKYKLPAAAYNLVTQVDGKGVFSFCMCPGGIIIPSSTENEELVVNGMSNSKRNSPFSNSGIVVTVEPADLCEYEHYGSLMCMRFQQNVERRFFNKQSETLLAPAQRMTDFVKGRISPSLNENSYFPGVFNAPLHELLPQFIATRMQKAFPLFNRKMYGYYTDSAMLIGLESRTSSPVRIIRDPLTLEHVRIKKLFPCGEGAGYSGGIVSSAIDGINVADKIKF